MTSTLWSRDWFVIYRPIFFLGINSRDQIDDVMSELYLPSGMSSAN